MLKTQFNPVWDAFDIRALQQAVSNSWLEEIARLSDNRVHQLYKFVNALGVADVDRLDFNEVRRLGDENGWDYRRGIPLAGSAPRLPRASEDHDEDSVMRDANIGSGDDEIVDSLAGSPSSEGTPLPLYRFVERDAQLALPTAFTWSDISFTYLAPLSFTSNSMEVREALDVRKVGLITARWMLSRKRFINYVDLLSMAKRRVLESRPSDAMVEEPAADDDSDIYMPDDVALVDDFKFDDPADY